MAQKKRSARSDLPFRLKFDHQIQHLGVAFKHKLLERMLKIRIDALTVFTLKSLVYLVFLSHTDEGYIFC